MRDLYSFKPKVVQCIRVLRNTLHYIFQICSTNLTIPLSLECYGRCYMEDVRTYVFLYEYEFVVHVYRLFKYKSFLLIAL